MPSKPSPAPQVQTLLAGLAFGESPRWHTGRLWFADWGKQQVVAIDLDSHSEVMVRVKFPSFPICFAWLPDGRLLVVSARDGQLLRREPNGALVTHADLNSVAKKGRLAIGRRELCRTLRCACPRKRRSPNGHIAIL